MTKYIYILLFSATLLSQSSLTWDPLPGPMGTNITFLYKTKTDILLAGTWYDAYKSIDHGKFWKRIKINDNIINTFFEHSSGRIFAGTIFGIFYSEDNAENWMNIGEGLLNDRIHCFAENSRGHIFAGAQGRAAGKYYGVYRSMDRGETWVELNSGLDVYTVNQIIVDTTDIIYAATEKGVFYSLNNGEEWLQLNYFSTNTIDLVFTRDHHILAGTQSGIYKFSKIDSLWSRLGLDSLGVIDLWQDNSGNIFAGTESNGLFWSDSTGSNWRKFGSANLYSQRINSITSIKNILFVGTGNGIFYYDEVHSEWIHSGLCQTGISYFSINGRNTIFVKMKISIPNYMWISNDGGDNWRPILNINIDRILKIEDNVVYAMTSHDIIFSDDNYQTWQVYKSFDQYLSLVTWIDKNSILVGTRTLTYGSNAKIFLTLNGGEFWDNIWHVPFFADIISIYPNKDGGLYVAAKEEWAHSAQRTALYYSSDYGDNWDEIIGLDYWNRILFDDDKRIFLTKDDKGILLFYPNSNQWFSLNKGLSTTFINSIRLTKFGDLLCSTNNGIYRLRTSDSTWICISEDLNGVIPRSILEDSEGRLFISTENDGIYKSNRSYLSNINTTVSDINHFQIFQNFPNPCNTSTVIPVEIPRNSNVSITLYNLLGEKVYHINKNMVRGRHLINIELKSLPSGVYFYDVKSGSLRMSKKLLILK